MSFVSQKNRFNSLFESLIINEKNNEIIIDSNIAMRPNLHEFANILNERKIITLVKIGSK